MIFEILAMENKIVGETLQKLWIVNKNVDHDRSEVEKIVLLALFCKYKNVISRQENFLVDNVSKISK